MSCYGASIDIFSKRCKVSLKISWSSFVVLVLIMKHMINKTMLSMFAIVAALTLATAVVATTIITANSAFAAGGPRAERNNGQCQQDFNSNVCKKFHTGGG
jgi:hypothetical protein